MSYWLCEVTSSFFLVAAGAAGACVAAGAAWSMMVQRRSRRVAGSRRVVDGPSKTGRVVGRADSAERERRTRRRPTGPIMQRTPKKRKEKVANVGSPLSPRANDLRPGTLVIDELSTPPPPPDPMPPPPHFPLPRRRPNSLGEPRPPSPLDDESSIPPLKITGIKE